MSNKDGVAGSGFGVKLVCEDANGKTLRDDWIAVGLVTSGAKDGRVGCDDKTSKPGVRGVEPGVEKEMSEVSFKLS